MNILIASADALMIWSLARALEKEGHATLLVNSEGDLSETLLFEDEPIDCLLLDHDPPDFDAIRIMSKVKAVAPEVTAVVFGSSVEEDPSYVEKLKSLGTFIEKPFRINELLKRICPAQREKA